LLEGGVLVVEECRKWLDLRFVDYSGLFKHAFAEEGYCSAPSGLSTEAKSKPLYWKVNSPTLSPIHLEG